MNPFFTPTNTLPPLGTAPIGEEQKRRRKRIEDIIDFGLPPFPHSVLELTTILSDPSADAKKAGKVVRTDPSLSAQVLRLCNSPMFGLRTRVISIEQATILIGLKHLRSLAVTCSLVNYSGKGLPRDQVMNFWRHSFLAARLSEHLAVQTDYSEKEQAYIAGLLHDIGQLPQWMLATEEGAKAKTQPPANWTDNLSVERDHFGMDHCEIGSSMAVTWNFMPSFIDVLGYHHDPREAQHDPVLVEIIGTVERYLLAKGKAAPSLDGASAQQPDAQPGSDHPVSPAPAAAMKTFTDAGPESVVEMLDKEYDQLIPVVEAAVASAVGNIR